MAYKNVNKIIKQMNGNSSAKNDETKTSSYKRSQIKSVDDLLKLGVGQTNKGVDNDYINKYIADTQAYSEKLNSAYGNRGYNSLSNYSQDVATARDLESRGNAIKTYLTQNRDKIDKGTYNDLMSYIQGYNGNRMLMENALSKMKDYASQFKSEDDFNNAQREQTYRQKYGGKSYADLMADYERASTDEKKWIDENKFDYMTPEELENRKNELTNERRSVADRFGDKLGKLLGNIHYDANGNLVRDGKNTAARERLENDYRIDNEIQVLNRKMQEVDWRDKYESLTPVQQKAVYDYANIEATGNLMGTGASIPNETRKRYRQIALNTGVSEEDIDNLVSLIKRKDNESLMNDIAQESYEIGANNFAVPSAIVSAGSSVIGGIAGTADILSQYARGTDKYGLDINTPAHALNTVSQNINQGYLENHDWKPLEKYGIDYDFADAGYQLGEMMLENLERFTLSKGVAETMFGVNALGGVSNATEAIKTATESGSMALMSGQVFSQSVEDGKKKGYSDNKAVVYGVVKGLIEGATEKWSVDKFMDAENAKNIFSAFIQTAVPEGTEELSGNWLDRIADRVMNGNYSDYSLKMKELTSKGMSEKEAMSKIFMEWLGEDVESFALGALSGGFGGGMKYGGEYVKTGVNKGISALQSNAEARKTVKGAINDSVNAAQLYGQAREAGVKSSLIDKAVAAQQAYTDKNSKENRRAVEIATKALVKATFKSNEKINTTAFRQGVLNELQGKYENAEEIASAVVKLSDRTKVLSPHESTLLSKISQEDINAAYNAGAAEVRQHQQRLLQMNERIAEQEYGKKIAEAEKRKLVGADREATITVDGEEKPLKSYKITSVSDKYDSDGNRIFTIEADGKEYSSDDKGVELKSDGVIIEAIAETGASADSIRSAVNMARTSGLSVQQFALAARERIFEGMQGIKNPGVSSRFLNSEQSKRLYEIGRELTRDKKAVSDRKTIQRKSIGKVNTREYLSKETYEKMWHSKNGRAKLEMTNALAKFLGRDITLVETFKDSNGDFYYKDSAGKKHKFNANGMFDIEHGRITLDVNSDRGIMNTLSHELVHLIRSESESAYREMADWLVEKYGERGKSLNNLVYQKMNEDSSLNYDAAFEEVVAESWSLALESEKTIDNLAELAKNNKTLFDRIREGFESVFTGFKEYLKIHQPIIKTVEAYNAQALKELDGYSELFVKALAKVAQGEEAAVISSNEEKMHVREGKYQSRIGTTEDGKGIYKTNYKKGTPKAVKQNNLISLVQSVWSKNPIELSIIKDGKVRSITARFDPELSERSDLSKIAFGNRKGTASEKRITLDLSSDLYQIAEDATYSYSKKETGKKDNKAHKDVSEWHYFLTNLVYEDEDGNRQDCHMNIDVKQAKSGFWFYSFAIEKGTAPQTLLAEVTDKSATVPTNSIDDSDENVNGKNKKQSKAEQWNIIKNSNPATDDIHAWIRSAGDILTFTEAVKENGREDFAPDYTYSDMQKALESGEITVYSSKPIENGTFVTPSKTEAQNYAGNGKVYSQQVNTADVAWLDAGQGQYAKVKNKKQQSKVDSEGNKLSEGQIKFFENSKVRDAEGRLLVMYHGAKNGGGFTVFKDWQYFTANKQYAERYTQRDNDDSLYEVYLNIEKPFDTRTTEAAKIFENMRSEYGLSNLQESGLHDWTDGYDIAEFIEENGLDYDGIMLDEGGDLVDGKPVKRGLSYVVRNSDQVKRIDNLNPTENEDIRYQSKLSDRAVEHLQAENRYLKRLIRIQGQITHGKLFTRTSTQAVAKSVISQFGAKGLNSATIGEKISKAYTNIMNTKQLSWDAVMDELYPIAKEIHNSIPLQRSERATDILKYIHDSNIKLDEMQKQEVAFTFGSYDKFRKALMGSVRISNFGTELDSWWQGTAESFPDVFGTETNSADMGVELYDIINGLKESYEDDYANEITREIQQELYDKFWSAATLYTVADKYTAEINRLKSEHRENIKKVKEDYDLRLKTQNAAEKYVREQKEMMKEKAKRLERTEYRKKIVKLIDNFNSMLTNPQKKKYVPSKLVKGVVDVLEAIDIDTGRGSKALRVKLDALSRTYEAYKDDPDFNRYHDEVIEVMLKELDELLPESGRIYDEKITLEQTRGVYQVLKSLQKLITSADEIKSGQQAIDRKAFGKALMRETNSVPKAKINPIYKWMFSQLSAERMFHTYGNWQQDSSWDKLYRILNDGQLKQTQLTMEGTRLFEKLFDNEHLKELYKMQSTKEEDLVDIGLMDADGNTVKITRAMMLSIAMHLRNEDNAKHVIFGGFTVPNLKQYYKGGSDQWGPGSIRAGFIDTKIYDVLERRAELRRNEAENEAELEEINKTVDKLVMEGMEKLANVSSAINKMLTPYEADWLDKASEFFDGWSKDTINKATMEMYDFKKANVKDYFPIHTDKNFRQVSFESIKRDFTLENAGWLKTRVHASNPILLEDITDVINYQIRQVSRFCGMAPAIREFQKAYGYGESNFKDSVQEAISNKFGKQGQKYIEELLADLQGASSPETTIDKYANILRGTLAQATLTLNLRVALAQAASYPTASAVVGHKALIKALKHGGQNNRMFSKADKDLIAKYSPLLWYRLQGNMDVDISNIKNQKGLDKINRKLYFLTNWIQQMDGMTVGRLWYAAEYYVADELGLSRDNEEQFYTKVAEVFNDVVEKTQPNYTTMQRPAVLRSKSSLMKMLTMFMTQRLQNFNIMYDAVNQYNADRLAFKNGRGNEETVKKSRSKLVSAVSSQVIATLTITVMKTLVDGLMHNFKRYRDDDDDELTAESIIGEMTNTFISSIVSNVWGGSELYDIINSLIKGDTYYGVSLQGFSSFENVVEYLVKFAKDISNGKTSSLSNDATKLGKAVCQFFGIPINNASKIATGIINWGKDIRNYTETGKFNTDSDVETTISRANKLLSGGNIEKGKRVLADYKKQKIEQKIKNGSSQAEAEKSVKTSMKSSATNYYKPLYLEAYENKDIATMNRIKIAMGITGVYDDVDSTINKWVKDSQK